MVQFVFTQHCDIVITVVRTNMEVSGSKGTSLLIVETDTAGFRRGRNLEKIGQHAADTSELFFEESGNFKSLKDNVLIEKFLLFKNIIHVKMLFFRILNYFTISRKTELNNFKN